MLLRRLVSNPYLPLMLCLSAGAAIGVACVPIGFMRGNVLAIVVGIILLGMMPRMWLRCGRLFWEYARTGEITKPAKNEPGTRKRP